MSKLSKHFDRSEFQCKCFNECGKDTVDAELITVLEDVREHFNQPVRINSAYRCSVSNKRVNGSENSQHLNGKAADITVDNITPLGVLSYLTSKYPNKYGIGRYQSFTHIDVRSTKARW